MRNVLKANAKRRVNRQFNETINNTYHPAVPMNKICKILKDSDITLLQEDGTPWSGFLCGTKGTDNFEIANEEGLITNCWLFLSWYKMSSGNYEVITYVS